jgi:hypothetical protein
MRKDHPLRAIRATVDEVLTQLQSTGGRRGRTSCRTAGEAVAGAVAADAVSTAELISTNRITRRRLLASTAVLAVGGLGPAALSRTYRGGSLPWEPNDTSPPMPVRQGPWVYLTANEAAVVEAFADRLIPPDESGPGGKEAGCAVFIDRQLAGSFGDSSRHYMRPPFAKGTPSQGPEAAAVGSNNPAADR